MEGTVLVVKFVQVAIFVQKTPEALFLVLVEHTPNRVALKIYPIVSCAQLASTVPQALAILCTVLPVRTIHYLVRMILMTVSHVELVQHAHSSLLLSPMSYVLLVTFVRKDQTSRLTLTMSVLPGRSLITTT